MKIEPMNWREEIGIVVIIVLGGLLYYHAGNYNPANKTPPVAHAK